MARLIFFLLLIANIAFGAHLYYNETRAPASPPLEINRDMLKIVSVADPRKAQQEAIAARKLAASLRGSACVDFGVKPADSTRAQALFAAMNLGDRLTLRNAEDFTRFSVTLPAQKDRRSAETVVANLKKSGVKDVSVMGDNSVSLGIYSSDEAAKKASTEIQAKGGNLVKDLQITPRSPQLREILFTVKEPDVNMVARLTLMQRDYESSSLKAVTCPASSAASAAPNAVVSPPDAKGSPEKAKP